MFDPEWTETESSDQSNTDWDALYDALNRVATELFSKCLCLRALNIYMFPLEKDFEEFPLDSQTSMRGFESLRVKESTWDTNERKHHSWHQWTGRIKEGK